MPPRRLIRHSTPESQMASVDLGSAEWERSKISTQDINLLKKLGISKKPKELCFPSEESYPTPPMEYRVSFVDHLIRGLSAPFTLFFGGCFLFMDCNFITSLPTLSSIFPSSSLFANPSSASSLTGRCGSVSFSAAVMALPMSPIT